MAEEPTAEEPTAEASSTGAPAGAAPATPAHAAAPADSLIEGPGTATYLCGDAQPPPLPNPCAQAAAALSLGQQMNQLYVTVATRTPPPSPTPPSSLPPPPAPVDPLAGLPALDDEERFQSQLLAVHSALFQLTTLVADAGLVMPSGDDLVEEEAALCGDVGCRAVAARHTVVLEVLGAASGLLRNAYDLGASLDSLRDRVAHDPRQLHAAVAEGGFDHLRNLINGLGSVLPPHAAHAVVGALNNWEDWLAAGTIGHRGIDWNTDGDTIGQAFTRQCDLWLSLLGGSKKALDLLSLDDYVDAGEALLRGYRDLGLRFAAQWWPLVTLGVVATAAIIAAFLVYGRGDTRGIGTITTLIASLGITLKTVTSLLEKTAANVESSLWEAELDRAVVHAATSLPAGDLPIVSPVVRPFQRKARRAAHAAVAARHRAIAERAAAAAKST